jgi:hypothetical protein
MARPDTGATRSFFHRVKPKSHQLPYFESGFGPAHRFNAYKRAALVGPIVEIP